MTAPEIACEYLPAASKGPTSPVVVYLASLGSNRSRKTQLQRLHKIAAIVSGGLLSAFEFPWDQMTYVAAQAVRTALCEEMSAQTGEKLSPAYINSTLAALRAVITEVWRCGLIGEEQRARICDLKPVRGSSLPRGRALTIGEKAALSATCQAGQAPAGVRDGALFALGFGCGLRRAEIVALDVTDFDIETGELRIRVGKGRKARLGHVSAGVRPALDEWLRLRGDPSGPLLAPVNKGGRIVLRRLSSHAVYLVCRKRAEEAGISTFSPHDMRRSFVSDLIDSGADLSVTQRLAGHSSITTTARYDRRPEARKREAAERLHFPWR
jgi:integrase